MTNGLLTNRIAGLIDDDGQAPSPPKSRSAARRSPTQREASRANGSKGHGPVTVSGKQRSSLNSLRHGLLAKKFTPPADARGDDRLCRKLRRELAAEFDPHGVVAAMTFDGLAFDVLQLTRARAMVESLQRPADAGVSAEDRRRYKQLLDERRDLKIVKRLVGRLDAGQCLDCGAGAASRIADRIHEAVRGLNEFVNDPDGLAEAEMGAEERETYQAYRARWLGVKRGVTQLLDRWHVSAVLRGLSTLGKAESKRLRTALEQVVVDLDRVTCGYENEKLDRQMQRCVDESVLTLARDPNGLLLLRRYITRIENAISRKVRELRRK
jgi:hypothetical protein